MDDSLNGFTGFANKGQRSVPRYVRKDTGTYSDEPLHFDPDQLQSIPQLDRRWAWVEIDLNAVKHNTQAIRSRIGNGRRLLAVVKSDAYGHGAVRVAQMALHSGADYLGVATINEAIELREALVNAPILILSQPPETAIPLLLGYKVMPAIYTPDFAIRYAETADAYGMEAPFHLAINTGMNRIGVRFDEVVAFLQQVSFHRALKLAGTFTHFATADEAETLDFQRQFKRFVQAVNAMTAAGFDPGIVHCANSAAAIRYPETHCDMVRWGISLYGMHPSQQTRSLIDLQPVMSVHARITDARFVPMSEGVSYGLHYRSPGSVKICTIPIGYADGYNRLLSSKTDVIFQGRRYKQVGNNCMDQCMFEVDLRSRGSYRAKEPQIGDEVLVLGRQGDAVITLDDMANTCGTISYELACNFGLRMPKVYV